MTPKIGGWVENTVAIMSAYTGRRAEHEMNGVTRMVTMRSLVDSMVRVAMMAGTAHAKPDNSGTNARPCSPMPAIRRSRMKAARAR